MPNTPPTSNRPGPGGPRRPHRNGLPLPLKLRTPCPYPYHPPFSPAPVYSFDAPFPARTPPQLPPQDDLFRDHVSESSLSYERPTLAPLYNISPLPRSPRRPSPLPLHSPLPTASLPPPYSLSQPQPPELQDPAEYQHYGSRGPVPQATVRPREYTSAQDYYNYNNYRNYHVHQENQNRGRDHGRNEHHAQHFYGNNYYYYPVPTAPPAHLLRPAPITMCDWRRAVTIHHPTASTALAAVHALSPRKAAACRQLAAVLARPMRVMPSTRGGQAGPRGQRHSQSQSQSHVQTQAHAQKPAPRRRAAPRTLALEGTRWEKDPNVKLNDLRASFAGREKRHVLIAGADARTRRQMSRASVELAGLQSVVLDTGRLPGGQGGAAGVRSAFALAARLAGLCGGGPATTGRAATVDDGREAERGSVFPTVAVEVVGATRLLARDAGGDMVYAGNALIGETARAARGVVVVAEVRDVLELCEGMITEWPVRVTMVAKDGSDAT